MPLNNDIVNPYENSVPMEFDWETDDLRLDDAVEDLLPLFENVQGHKSLLRKHLRLVLIVCSRMFKYNPSKYVGYVRDNNYTGSRKHRNPLGCTTRPLIKVIDTLVENDFLEHHMGFNGPVRIRRSSRFKATEMLVDFIQDYELESLRFRRELIRDGIVLNDLARV